MENDPLKVIAQQVYLAIDKKIENIPYDKTISSKITDIIDNNEYTIRIGKNYRNIRSISSRKYNIGDMATVSIPCSNWNEARIIDKTVPYIQTGSENIVITNLAANGIMSYQISFPVEMTGVPTVVPIIVTNQTGTWNAINISIKDTTNSYFVISMCNTSSSTINTELTVQYIAVVTSNI